LINMLQFKEKIVSVCVYLFVYFFYHVYEGYFY
jgi:hypothetical protein